MENIKELRNFLGDAMKALKDGTLSNEKAKTIRDLGQVLVNSAKVEVDFIKAAKVKDATDFISAGVVKSLHGIKEQSKTIEEQPVQGERPKAEYTNNGHLQLQDKYKTA
jgi:hypothetical protein